MNDNELIETLINAWKMINAQYQNSPSESMRCAVNLVGKICAIVESEYNKRKDNEGKQITIEEWLDWLNSNV